ncbi:MAG: N-acetyltransferase [Planctomycetales bacterium]|nr:N-acetyltransferase [Planctomycetales bacterium]
MISIRKETTDDHDQIRTVTIDAFANSEFGYNGESELIDSLRLRYDTIISLVACSGSKVVGHALFTPVVVRTSTNETVGMGLAPMSVSPSHQRAGVGSLLVTDGLRRLHDASCPFVVVLGHADYYPRFGFRPASQIHVSHGFSGIPQDVFFIQTSAEETIIKLTGGRAYYDSAFGHQHDGK